MKSVVFFLIGLFFIQFSCDVTDSEEEDVGTLITSRINTNWLNLIWSKAGDELIVGGEEGIKVIEINTSEIRTLQDSCTFAMVLSSDGNTIFYLEGPGLQGDIEPLYRISLNGGDKELLSDDVYVDCFYVCPQNLHVAYKRGSIVEEDSVYILNIETKAKKFLCQGIPRAFSPDGQKLICATFMGVNPEYFIVDIENGNITPLYLESLGIDENYHSFIVTFKWLDDGIYILYSLGEPEVFYVHNYTVNRCVYCWEIPPFGTMHFCWSDDAEKVAYWRWDGTYNKLFVASSGGLKKVIVTKTYFIGNIAISADNKKIVYVIGSSIYMKDI